MDCYQVFDFDGTIYDGDSSIDFFIFSLQKYPSCIRILPRFIYCSIRYLMKKCTKDQLKESYFSFLQYVPDVPQMVNFFWETKQVKIHGWYNQRKHARDIIISASPDFLIRPLMLKYGVHTVIATDVDPRTGKFLGKNCYGQEKINRLVEELGEIEIDQFYSDSISDLPIAKCAKEAYLVRNGKIQRWQFSCT